MNNQSNRPEYEEWLSKRPSALVYHPEPIPGGVREPLISTNHNTGRSSLHGSKITDPTSGDCIELPWGHRGDQERFVLRNVIEGVSIADGNTRGHWYPHRRLMVIEITRVSTAAKRWNLSRSEFDGSRIARLISLGPELHREEILKRGILRRIPPIEVIMVDSRPEFPQGIVESHVEGGADRS